MKYTLNEIKFTFLFVVTLSLAACFNDNVANHGVSSSAESTASTATTGSTTAGPSFTIVSATLTYANATNTGTGTATGTGTTTAPTVTIGINATTTTKLTDVCQVQANGNSDPTRACKCRFSWSETNLSDASVYNRTVDTEPSLFTSFQTQCLAPDVWVSEIPDNTVLKVSVVPNSFIGNTSGFTTNSYNLTKTSQSSTGDFRDIEGRSYKNIFHYVCYDLAQKALTIDHKIQTLTQQQSNGSSVQVFTKIANEFEKGTGNQSNVASYTAQNYYYDFYVRSNELGSISSMALSQGATSGFVCPQVSISGTPSFYPLDSTFALSTNYNRDFNIIVRARINVAEEVAGTSNNVLGYAAKPNSDGTCPSFMDSSGSIRRTLRLRKYVSVRPRRFDADAKLLDNQQSMNYVYVLDRPVDKAGQDPLKPMTRLGPKPCPFAYKDANSNSYKCQTDSTLTGNNLDGTLIPADNKCPIYPPVPSTLWDTVNGGGAGVLPYRDDGSLIIRPYKAYLDYWIEDTLFKGCAFQPTNPIDPPIVLSHDDSVFSSSVGPFDFYCSKNYPAADNIIAPAAGSAFDKPPSECAEAETATAIKGSSLYACSKSYDPTNNARITPQAGCCQICSGSNCTTQGGGLTPYERNAAFSPAPAGAASPVSDSYTLTRGIPNINSTGCFDPYEP